jgi:tetratricopeptide (TPR) repeat protein
MRLTEHVDAHFNLGLALEKMGRTTEAIAHYEQALKLRPDFTPAKKRVGAIAIWPVNGNFGRSKRKVRKPSKAGSLLGVGAKPTLLAGSKPITKA